MHAKGGVGKGKRLKSGAEQSVSERNDTLINIAIKWKASYMHIWHTRTHPHLNIHVQIVHDKPIDLTMQTQLIPFGVLRHGS